MKRVIERKLTKSMQPLLSPLQDIESESDSLPLLTEEEALLPDSDKDCSSFHEI